MTTVILPSQKNHDQEKNSLRQFPTRGTIDNGEVTNLHPERRFGILSVLGSGYSVTNTAMAVLASLATGIGSGGPVTLVWGQLVMVVVAFCIAISLGELASAMPNAAGQFYWVSRLAPKSVRAGLSYTVGILAWTGSICITASGTLITPLMIIGMYLLRHPEFVYKPWMGLVGFQGTNLFVFVFNISERFLPTLSKSSMFFSIISTTIILVSILAASPTKQSAEFVFIEFVNLSGWTPNAISVLTGIIGINWGYSCLDACAHLAEEIPNPERNIPKTLLATVGTGFLTGFPITLAILFCIKDIDAVILTPTGVPSLELFSQAFSGNTAAAIGLQSLVVVTFLGSVFGAHTWQSRLCWTLARHNGLPFSEHLKSIAPEPFGTPLWAHILSCCCVALLGFVYLGSTTAFNSFVSGGLLLQYMSYSACIVCLLIHGRSKFEHGPFWFPKFGPFANCVTLLWTIFAVVFYSFPPIMPVTANNMNYVSIVLGAIVLFATIVWWVSAKHKFMLLD